MENIENKIQELYFKLNSEKPHTDKVIEMGNKIEKIHVLLLFYIEENRLFFEKYPVSQDMFIDLCDNILGIKHCMLGGATISINVILRRIIEIVLNFKIIFEDKSLFESRLDFYEKYLFVKNHEVMKKLKNPSKEITELKTRYETIYRPINKLKNEFRDDGGNMKRYNPIFCNTENKKISIEWLLKKYSLNKIGNQDMYDYWCNRSHPTILSRGSIIKPWSNHLYGSYNISEYERVVGCYLRYYSLSIISSTFDIIGCDKELRNSYFNYFLEN